MPPLLKTIINAIQEDFGRPASLYALLDAHHDLSATLGEPPATSRPKAWHGGMNGVKRRSITGRAVLAAK
ncbi:hypothetical protein [Aeromonas veronii]|uniref:hypothetical protein n=1 Tax=Aeromonas veronii TaxID=654 RepID=UPI000EB175CB|nr:hypothetical protein [Aeromonas veronii]AYK20424.1 hypothetical protein C0073_021875 [Aeromonas veronii]AYK20499.1 hypothetical protein C0073_022580 [Aeromonas veronii]